MMPAQVEPAQAEAVLRALADAPEGLSLPRLCKRLQWRMSVLLRVLAWLGEDEIGAQPGAGWVRVEQQGERPSARLTPRGREAWEALSGSM